MNAKQEQMIRLIGDKGCVSLGKILSNLKVLKTEGYSDRVCYVLTRNNKNFPWPAPYEASREVDGQSYYCCSYATLSDDEWPEDTKKLIVYRMFVDD